MEVEPGWINFDKLCNVDGVTIWLPGSTLTTAFQINLTQLQADLRKVGQSTPEPVHLTIANEYGLAQLRDEAKSHDPRSLRTQTLIHRENALRGEGREIIESHGSVYINGDKHTSPVLVVGPTFWPKDLANQYSHEREHTLWWISARLNYEVGHIFGHIERHHQKNVIMKWLEKHFGSITIQPIPSSNPVTMSRLENNRFRVDPYRF